MVSARWQVDANRGVRAPVSAGAVIVAAGSSRRMGGEDKVLLPLAGEPVLARTVEAFEACPGVGEIVIVVRAGTVSEVRRMVSGRDWGKVSDICAGGCRRQDSVLAGLARLGDWPWVVIQDGARPLVTADLIVRGLEAAVETGAAVAAVPVTDTVKLATADGLVKETLARDKLWAVQTPQVFRADILADAYRQVDAGVTDDATLVERAGYAVKLFEGSRDNIKITVPDDVALAAALWQRRTKRNACRNRL